MGFYFSFFQAKMKIFGWTVQKLFRRTQQFHEQTRNLRNVFPLKNDACLPRPRSAGRRDVTGSWYNSTKV